MITEVHHNLSCNTVFYSEILVLSFFGVIQDLIFIVIPIPLLYFEFRAIGGIRPKLWPNRRVPGGFRPKFCHATLFW